MSIPQDDPKGNLELDPGATSADEILPPVQAPNAGFLLQLFLIPMLIVVIIMLVWLVFSWFAHMGNNPSDLVTNIEKGRANAWQSASTLANLLRDPKREDLRRDTELASDVSRVLRGRLAQPISKNADAAQKQIMLRCFLCQALAHFNTPEVLPVLIEAMNHMDSERDLAVRQSAVQAAAVLAINLDKEALLLNSDLEKALLSASRERTDGADAENQRGSLRGYAAFSMGVIGGDVFWDRLEVMLTDSFPNVRYNAAVGLARQGDIRSVPVLLEMMDPDNEDVVKGEKEGSASWKRASVIVNALRAARQLAEKNPDADVSKLLDAATTLSESKDKGVRVEAQKTIAQWKQDG